MRRFQLATSILRSAPAVGFGRRCRRGFTLLEVVLVLALMVAITAIAATNLRSGFRTQRLRKAAEQVRSEWARARNEAIKKGRAYVFHHALQGRRFLVMPQMSLDDPWPAAGGGNGALGTFGQTGPVGQTGLAGSAPLDVSNRGTGAGSADPWRDQNALTLRQRELPDHVIFLGANVLFDQRSAIQMGQTVDPSLIDQSNRGLGMDVDSDRAIDQQWGTPIYFFPDGSSSSAELMLLNDHDEAIRVYLRGLTGTVRVGQVQQAGQVGLQETLR